MVTTTLVEEFKNRMKISHDIEDKELQDSLSFSIAYVEDKCGTFDIEGETNTDKRAKELVLERSRYAYNEALEYFEDNFLSAILSLSVEMAGVDDAEERIS